MRLSVLPPVPAMGWQLMVLSLLYSAYTARASNLDSCGVHPHLLPAAKARKCSFPPCTTTSEEILTLALPVMFSLEYPRLTGVKRSDWGMRLNLLDDRGAGRGAVDVGWEEERREVVLRGWTCGGKDWYNSFPAAAQSVDSWLHLQVEATGQQVAFINVKASGKIPSMTLTFQGDAPSTAVVSSTVRVGYSASTTTEAKGWYSWCDKYSRPRNTSATRWCFFSPCTVTKGNVKLPLPVLLSLRTTPRAFNIPFQRDLELHLLDDTDARRAIATLEWDEEEQRFVVWGRACGGREIKKFFFAPYFLQFVSLRLQVEATEREVTVSVLGNTEVTALTITFPDNPPSTVVVLPNSFITVGYSDVTSLLKVVISNLVFVINFLINLFW